MVGKKGVAYCEVLHATGFLCSSVLRYMKSQYHQRSNYGHCILIYSNWSPVFFLYSSVTVYSLHEIDADALFYFPTHHSTLGDDITSCEKISFLNLLKDTC